MSDIVIKGIGVDVVINMGISKMISVSKIGNIILIKKNYFRYRHAFTYDNHTCELRLASLARGCVWSNASS